MQRDATAAIQIGFGNGKELLDRLVFGGAEDRRQVGEKLSRRAARTVRKRRRERQRATHQRFIAAGSDLRQHLRRGDEEVVAMLD